MKGTLNEYAFKREMKRIQLRNTQLERRAKLLQESRKYANHIETSKLIAIYLFVLLNAIVVYAMISMWHFADLSYLGVLVSDIAAQVLIYAIYCLKAYHAKKQSEQIKLNRDRLGDILNAGAESEQPVPLTAGDITLY